jgi:hypothetical protein
MKNAITLFVILPLFISKIFAQNTPLDSIFTSEGLILANVKSVEPEVINYAYPNEEVVTSIYKNTVMKIRFKSGRIQNFTEAFALKTLGSAYDYDQVSLTRLESETKGLIKLDEVFARSFASPFSNNFSKAQDAAQKKIKIQAAMMGGNIVYLFNQDFVQEPTTEYQWGSGPGVVLSGIVFANAVPKLSEVKRIISNNNSFKPYLYTSIRQNDINLDREYDNPPPLLFIKNIYEEEGLVFLEAKAKNIDNQVFRITFLEKDMIGIVWKDNKRIYNIYFNPKEGVEGK